MDFNSIQGFLIGWRTFGDCMNWDLQLSMNVGIKHTVTTLKCVYKCRDDDDELDKM